MKNFIALLNKILDDGEWKENRTDQPTKSLFGEYLEFDLRLGFPAVTIKQLPTSSVFAELVAFIRGYSNVQQFQMLGTSIWNANAKSDYWLRNPNNKGDGDLGRIYGVQWRNLRTAKGSAQIDQLQNLIDGIRHDPYGRRHIVTAWNPGELEAMALPPCHILFQCNVSPAGYLDLAMYQRSCDVFLGLPFNIASYAALLTYIAALTQLTPRKLSITLGDAHLYQNQISSAMEAVEREPLPLSRLDIRHTPNQQLSDVCPEDFVLKGYLSHPALRVPMVV